MVDAEEREKIEDSFCFPYILFSFNAKTNKQTKNGLSKSRYVMLNEILLVS